MNWIDLVWFVVGVLVGMALSRIWVVWVEAEHVSEETRAAELRRQARQ